MIDGRVMKLLLFLMLVAPIVSPAHAEMLGRFEVLDARSRNADAAGPAAIVWSLDTLSGALSACTAVGPGCKTANPWKPGEIGAQRYRIASQYLEGSEAAYLWVIDTATGAIQRCRSALAAEPGLSCGE
jgi:hypothetical protein